jgi:hypothetical protein
VGQTYDRIDDRWREWIARQPMFFVGTAPLAGDGHVNVSPKGPIGSFRVIDDHTVAYLDVMGSGAETIAHLRENGRIVVMFCAFDGPPRIFRMHGRGEVVQFGSPEFDSLVADLGFEQPAVDVSRRAVIVVHVERIADSCGYGVPLMEQVGQRDHFERSKRKRLRVAGAEAMRADLAERNARSIDGLPAVAR